MKKLYLIGFTLFTFLPLLLNGCGSWEKLVTLNSFDHLLSQDITIPISFEYGYGSPTTTSVVSNDNLDAISNKINSLPSNNKKTKIFNSNLVAYIPVNNEVTSIMLIKQKEAKTLDHPLNEYKYLYHISDMFVSLHNNEDSISFVFPSHLLNSEPMYLDKKYKTDFNIAEFEKFYDEFVACYGIQSKSLYILENKIILNGNLIGSANLNNIKQVELVFSQEQNKNYVSITVIKS